MVVYIDGLGEEPKLAGGKLSLLCEGGQVMDKCPSSGSNYIGKTMSVWRNSQKRLCDDSLRFSNRTLLILTIN